MKQATVLLKETFDYYKGSFASILKFSVWILVPAVAIFLVELIGGQTEGAYLLSGILQIFAGFFLFWVLLALTQFIADGKKELTGSFTQFAPKSGVFLAIIWIVILVGIIELVGFVLLIIPGLIFAVWYAFAQYTTLLEGKRGMEALKQSKMYVKGRFWPIVGRLLLGGIVLLVIYLVVELIMIGLGELLTPASADYFYYGTNPLVRLFSAVSDVFMLPLFTVYGTFLYLEVKNTFKPQTGEMNA